MKKNEIKYGTILSYVYLVIYNISQLVYTPILLNSLGSSLYGVYSLCISIVNYFTILDFGLGAAVIRYSSIYKDKNEKERNSIFGYFFLIYVVLAIIALVIGIIVALNSNILFSNEFSNEDIGIARTIIIILTVNIAISLPLSVFSSVVTAYQKFVVIKVLNILKTLVSTIIMILLLLNGYKAIALSCVTLIINLMYLLAITYYAIKHLNVKLEFSMKNKKIIKEIFSFSMFSFILLIVDKINLSSDMIILGKLSNPTELTIYSISSRIFQIFITFGGVISSMLLPRYSKLIDDNKIKELNEDFIEKSKWQFTIVIYICFAFLLFGNSFLSIWLGGDYQSSYVLIVLLMFSSAIPLSLNVANVILQAKNKQKFRAIVLIIVLVLNVTISVILCRKYGAFGCTIGTALTYILGHAIIMGIYLRKNQKLDMFRYWKNIFRTSSVHLITFVFVYIIGNIFAKNIFTNLLELISYLIVVSILEYKYLMNIKEKQLLLSVFKKMRLRK